MTGYNQIMTNECVAGCVIYSVYGANDMVISIKLHWTLKWTLCGQFCLSIFMDQDLNSNHVIWVFKRWKHNIDTIKDVRGKC